MPKVMRQVTMVSVLITIVAAILFQSFKKDIFLTLAVTFGTTAYHLGSRLLVGFLYNRSMKKRADYTKKWYQLHSWERKLYRLLQVKTWKGRLPVYEPADFSPKEHTWDEIAQVMCQAELVHETNMILSFMPIIASKWFGAFYVFLITSLWGALFDGMFVMIQRYNRDRVIKIVTRCGSGKECK